MWRLHVVKRLVYEERPLDPACPLMIHVTDKSLFEVAVMLHSVQKSDLQVFPLQSNTKFDNTITKPGQDLSLR
jgi:hypothetical protein